MPRTYKATMFPGRVQQRNRAAYAAAEGMRNRRVMARRTPPFFAGRRSRMDTEWKFLDTSIATTGINAVGNVFTNLNVIPQGAGQSERIGRKVTIRSIWIRGNIVLPPQAAGAAATDVTRIIVVQDKQANKAAFAVADVLAGTPNYLSYRDLENSNRFKILRDFSTPQQSTGGVVAATLEGNNIFEWFSRVNIPIEFDSTAATGAITTQTSNSIAVIAINQGGLTTLEYTARIRYTDD